MKIPADWIVPNWPAPHCVKALITTRAGGFSHGRYASFNLGDQVGDEPLVVRQNRELLRRFLPNEPNWLRQVHGTEVANADAKHRPAESDASIARKENNVCAVLSADCLPLLLCDSGGSVVAAAHCGWRGIATGIIEKTVIAMRVAPQALLAYLGPAISPKAYEVGVDVREAFLHGDASAEQAFAANAPGKWLADLYMLARLRLSCIGVKRIYCGNFCTYTDSVRFFSHRRDGNTGRMASLIWLETKSN
ncbi:MAG TPA: peptidoglycan editing factor PgeF [Burkholderiales bacterium]|nr:peptidoglycan editing factor PgeF [Burkholderiales bacterium]